jgi:hypothetical protein
MDLPHILLVSRLVSKEVNDNGPLRCGQFERLPDFAAQVVQLRDQRVVFGQLEVGPDDELPGLELMSRRQPDRFVPSGGCTTGQAQDDGNREPRAGVAPRSARLQNCAATLTGVLNKKVA